MNFQCQNCYEFYDEEPYESKCGVCYENLVLPIGSADYNMDWNEKEY